MGFGRPELRVRYHPYNCFLVLCEVETEDIVLDTIFQRAVQFRCVYVPDLSPKPIRKQNTRIAYRKILLAGDDGILLER